MKTLMIAMACVLGAAGVGAGIALAQPQQQLTVVLVPVNSIEDQKACAKAGGAAAMIAPLMDNGNIGGEFVSFCAVPVTKN